MRFFFHKTNRAEFDRQVDRLWNNLPDRGGCVCDIAGHREAMPRSVREYYFKFVIEPIEKQYGHSKKDLHQYFKNSFGPFFTDDVDNFHVFGNLSTLTQDQKESFVKQVRDFALHDIGIKTEPWRGIE